jgi:hypothetical protein
VRAGSVASNATSGGTGHESLGSKGPGPAAGTAWGPRTTSHRSRGTGARLLSGPGGPAGRTRVVTTNSLRFGELCGILLGRTPRTPAPVLGDVGSGPALSRPVAAHSEI